MTIIASTKRMNLTKLKLKYIIVQLRLRKERNRLREIKFRGQTRMFGEKVNLKGEKLPGEWVYGGFFQGVERSVIYDGETYEKHTVYNETVGQYTGLKDKNGREIYEGDITELEVGSDIRRFVVNIKTVIRDVVSHPSFYDETAKVAITGVVFEWNGFELFPCVDEKGQFDNAKMTVVGNIYENPELLDEVN